MKSLSRLFWAVMAIAITLVINTLPANAQSRTWRRDGAAAPAPSGDACVSVDRAVATLEALCKNPAYASCGRCAQYRPCMGGCTPGTGTATPPGGPVTYAYSQECAPNQEPIVGCKVDNGKVTCAANYAPVTVGTRSLGSSGNVRSIVLQKQCFATNRSEKEIAEINEQIRKLIEADARFAKTLSEFSDRLDRVEAEVADLRGKIKVAREMAISANIKVDELKGRVDSIEEGLVILDRKLERVAAGSAKLELAVGVFTAQRGPSGTFMGGIAHVGFQATVPDTQLILWADAQGCYGSSDGVRLDGSKGPMWCLGGGAGIGTTFDQAGRWQGRLGFRGSQNFVTGIGESDRGFALGGTGSVTHTFPSNIFLRLEGTASGGQVGHYSQDRAMVNTTFIAQGTLLLGVNTDFNIKF